MKKTIAYIFMWIVIIGLIVVGAIFLVTAGKKPGELKEFAQCIKDSGTKFYGAFWCSHCHNQKALFGDSVDYLPYVECSTPDGQGMLEVCEKAGVESFPTWIFPNGSKETGEHTLEALAEKTGCELPASASEDASDTSGQSSAAQEQPAVSAEKTGQ